MPVNANPPPSVDADGKSAPAPAKVPDERRREALRKLGRGAAYAVPATLALMSMTRSAKASEPG